MKLFNLGSSELEFFRQELKANSPSAREFNAHSSNCQVCHSVCATGCGANCKGRNSSSN